jgi:hypothetical protein
MSVRLEHFRASPSQSVRRTKPTTASSAVAGEGLNLTKAYGPFDDYNESHPHSGLGVISPRVFIRAQAT